MDKFYDAIVIGVGSMGSSACYHLAKKGLSVLGLDQFRIPHENGAHTGQSRIIRKAYFEHPDYVPLLQKAYEGWKEIQKVSATQLYYETGLVYFGNPAHELIKGVLQSASLYNIAVENVPFHAISQRFPSFSLPENFIALWEREAGFLLPEKAIEVYAGQAVKNGATIHTEEKVLGWKLMDNYTEVVTDKNRYRCNRLVITAGPWAGKLIPGLKDILKITRQYVAWVQPNKPENFLLNKFPCWLIADDNAPGAFYGFPVLPAGVSGGPAGMKLAHHHPGEIKDPDLVQEQHAREDEYTILNAINKYLPGATAGIADYKTCLYANSPDENFIIGMLPGHKDRVIIAAGFSGHGFKFIPVVGEMLAGLVVDGATKHPPVFLSPERFLQ